MSICFNNHLLSEHIHYSDGSVFPALTGFGQQFVHTGFLRDYGYVRGGMTGYRGCRMHGPCFDALRTALRNTDLPAIVQLARRIPSLQVEWLPHGGPGGKRPGFHVRYKGCKLLEMPIVQGD